MWTVIYMAQNKEIINKLHQLLEEKNILVMVRPVCKGQEVEDNCCYEVLVPESEVTEAHNIIIDAEL